MSRLGNSTTFYSYVGNKGTPSSISHSLFFLLERLFKSLEVHIQGQKYLFRLQKFKSSFGKSKDAFLWCLLSVPLNTDYLVHKSSLCLWSIDNWLLVQETYVFHDDVCRWILPLFRSLFLGYVKHSRIQFLEVFLNGWLYDGQ